jgi:hypothetical protein
VREQQSADYMGQPTATSTGRAVRRRCLRGSAEALNPGCGQITWSSSVNAAVTLERAGARDEFQVAAVEVPQEGMPCEITCAVCPFAACTGAPGFVRQSWKPGASSPGLLAGSAESPNQKRPTNSVQLALLSNRAATRPMPQAAAANRSTAAAKPSSQSAAPGPGRAPPVRPPGRRQYGQFSKSGPSSVTTTANSALFPRGSARPHPAPSPRTPAPARAARSGRTPLRRRRAAAPDRHVAAASAVDARPA